MEPLWLALQESSFASVIRNALLVYPIANVTHVVAVIAFFAAVAAMDMSLLRVTGPAQARAVIARLRPIALVLFLAIAASGFILFSAEAVALARNGIFQFKIAAIMLALANVAVNEGAARRTGETATLVKITAALSLAVWLVIAALGRTIAYV